MKLPKGKRALETRWIFRVKQDSNSTLPRYKARLVVKGFRQKKDVDNEIFSPVVKMSSIRTVISLAATLDLEVEQMDVKTTFLHGNLEEEIYMKQPDGFLVKGKEDYVCRLRKSLYGNDGGYLHIVVRGRFVGYWAPFLCGEKTQNLRSPCLT